MFFILVVLVFISVMSFFLVVIVFLYFVSDCLVFLRVCFFLFDLILLEIEVKSFFVCERIVLVLFGWV